MDVDEQPNTDRRYVWLNLNNGLVNIGTSYMAYFVPIASTIERLKFNMDENWSNYEEGFFPSFSSVKEIHVLCLNGFENWGDDVNSYLWPCALENLVFIDEHTAVGYPEVGHLEIERINQKLLMEGRRAIVGEYQTGNMRPID